MVEVLPRFNLSGDLVHVSYHLRPGDLLYLKETHDRHWQEARQLYGAVPFASSLHLSRTGDTHAHDIAPVEVFPRLAAYLRGELEAGVSPRSLKLSGQRLLELLDEHQHRPEMFVSLVYDLPGLIDYIRVQPRIEEAKRSDSHRNITDAERKDSAEFLLIMRRANGGRNPAASRIFNVPRRTPDEREAYHAAQAALRLEAAERLERRRLERRRLEAAERRERLDAERLVVRRQVAERDRHRAAHLAGIRARKAARLPTGTTYRAPHRWPVCGRPVSRMAYMRRTRTAPTRAPPRVRPRVRSLTPGYTRPSHEHDPRHTSRHQTTTDTAPMRRTKEASPCNRKPL